MNPHPPMIALSGHLYLFLEERGISVEVGYTKDFGGWRVAVWSMSAVDDDEALWEEDRFPSRSHAEEAGFIAALDALRRAT